MKEMRRNMTIVLLLFLSAFIFMVGFLSYSVYFYGGRWFASPYNTRIRTEQKRITLGNVMDRNGVVLATTNSKGKRVYPESGSLRRSVAHVVGDDQAVVSTGVQTFHAGDLLGFNMNLIDRVAQVFQSANPRGNDIALTIDAKLQQYASERFPEDKNGAVVVLDYKTGEVLAMVSKPEFDLYDVDRSKTNAGIGNTMLNRATQGQYAPGSIFKIITTYAALSKIPQMSERTNECEGEIFIGERALREGDGKAHGEMNLKKSFEVSCNVVYGKLGIELGTNTMRSAARKFAFDDDFVFRDVIVNPSHFPTGSIEDAELGWTSVGQGKTTVTPMHMALIAAAIGNDGEMMEPHVVKQVQSPVSQRVLRWSRPNPYKRCASVEMAETLTDYMAGVVKSGTGTRAAIKGHKVVGKTGTAQVSDTGNVKSHSWFIGFIDEAEHPLAICTMVENGGSGGTVAAPLASKVLQKAISLGY